jgi:two-component system KDP operon response regulator KdpE
VPPSQLLLVEDDPRIVRALLPALEVSGHNVTVAEDGTTALAHLNKRTWDALVVDLGLPDMDGKQVVQHLRATSDVPVVVISARHSTKDQDECAAVGATGFLMKPFATPDLIGFLKAALVDRRPNLAS